MLQNKLQGKLVTIDSFNECEIFVDPRPDGVSTSKNTNTARKTF